MDISRDFWSYFAIFIILSIFFNSACDSASTKKTSSKTTVAAKNTKQGIKSELSEVTKNFKKILSRKRGKGRGQNEDSPSDYDYYDPDNVDEDDADILADVRDTDARKRKVDKFIREVIRRLGHRIKLNKITPKKFAKLFKKTMEDRKKKSREQPDYYNCGDYDYPYDYYYDAYPEGRPPGMDYQYPQYPNAPMADYYQQY